MATVGQWPGGSPGCRAEALPHYEREIVAAREEKKIQWYEAACRNRAVEYRSLQSRFGSSPGAAVRD